MEPSLPGAQNNNTGSGTQSNNNGPGIQNNGLGRQYMRTNNIGTPSSEWISSELQAVSREAERIASQNNIRGKHKHGLHFFVPSSRNPTFTPRNAVAQEIDNLLAQRVIDEQMRIAIHGLGGTGKTQIAINLAYANKKVCNVYCVNGDTVESFIALYSAISQHAQLNTQKTPSGSCLDVKRWLESEDSKDWLLFVDNADQLTDTYVESIQAYLPRSNKGVIIFIGRDGSIGGKLVHPEFCIKLEPVMTNDEATMTFKSALRKSIHVDNADVEQIVRRLDYLPLAIVQAVVYIRQYYITIAKYLNKLEKSEVKLLAILLQEVDQRARSVMTTWKVSCDYIHRQNASARDLLDIMSYFDFQDIQKTLLRLEDLAAVKIINKIDLDKAVGLLQAFTLVSSTPSSYRIPRLVSLWTRHNIKSTSEAIRIALQIVLTNFRKHTKDKLLQYEVLLPHVEAILQHTVGINALSNNRYRLLSEAARCYNNAGQCLKSEQYFRQCLLFYEKTQGKDHSSTLKTIENIARIYNSQGRYEEALRWFWRALAGYEKTLGKDHSSTLGAVYNIAYIYSNQGRYEEALKWYGRALAGREKTLGKDHSSTIDMVYDKAYIYSNQGRHEEALKWYGRALAGYDKTLGKDHLSTLDMVYDKTKVYHNQGRYEEALEWYGRALAGYEKIQGKDHSSTLGTVYNIAHIYSKQGRDKEALEWYGRALAGYEKMLGKDHSSTLDTVDKIAHIYNSQGRREEAFD